MRTCPKIRTATESDAQALCDLAKSTFIQTFAQDNRKEDMDLYVAETFSTNKQLHEICDSNRRIEIAWSGRTAVGFVHLLKSKPESCITGPKPIELLRLYVDSTWQGKGIGTLLMEKCIEVARHEGFQTLWLGVWERNFKAQQFYFKYGFSTVGKHTFKLGTDEQIDFIMTRSI
jgi:diamine N-acetyltransferase